MSKLQIEIDTLRTVRNRVREALRYCQHDRAEDDPHSDGEAFAYELTLDWLDTEILNLQKRDARAGELRAQRVFRRALAERDRDQFDHPGARGPERSDTIGGETDMETS